MHGPCRMVLGNIEAPGLVVVSISGAFPPHRTDGGEEISCAPWFRVTGCMLPVDWPRPGRVTSIRSAASFAAAASDPVPTCGCRSSSCSACLTTLILAPAAGHLFGRQLAQAHEQGGKLAFLAQVVDPQLLQRGAGVAAAILTLASAASCSSFPFLGLEFRIQMNFAVTRCSCNSVVAQCARVGGDGSRLTTIGPKTKKERNARMHDVFVARTAGKKNYPATGWAQAASAAFACSRSRQKPACHAPPDQPERAGQEMSAFLRPLIRRL